jgi:asparaginyl-tRNA synthetase
MGADQKYTLTDSETSTAVQGPVGRLPPTPRQHLSSVGTRATLRIQHRLLTAAREYLCNEGFVELLQPIIGPVTDPGTRGSKQVDIDYYGHRYKLMTSGILYKQGALLGFEKIFYIGLNVRLEPPHTVSTSRHLAEFHQIDIEIAGASRAEAMRVASGVVSHAVLRVVEELPEELAGLGRDLAALSGGVAEDFDEISHHEAIELLRKLDRPHSAESEIDWECEELLSRTAQRPFFIVDYPRGCRGFYDRESRTEDGVLRNFDLIAPEGYGELASGSEREFEYRRLIERMRETGENPAKYSWYLEIARGGIPPSAGCGIGVERLTRYVAGLQEIWQASAFPKIPGVPSP